MEALLILSVVMLARQARKGLPSATIDDPLPLLGQEEEDKELEASQQRAVMNEEGFQEEMRKVPPYAGAAARLNPMAADFIYSDFRPNGQDGPGQFQPGWMRAAAPSVINRTERLNDLSRPLEDHRDADAVDLMRFQGDRAVNVNYPRLRQTNNTPVEQEFIRPPRRGGDEGYEETRGRMPIPRYNRYDLGPELTTGLSDNGAVRGRGDAIRGRTVRGDGWEVMPDRSVRPEARAQNLPFRPAPVATRGRVGGSSFLGASRGGDATARDPLSWENGATGRKAPALKARVYHDEDPSDKRYLENRIDAFESSQGTNLQDQVGRTSMRDQVLDRLGRRMIPEETRAAAFVASMGANNRPDVDMPSLRPQAGNILHRIETPRLPAAKVGKGPKGGSVAEFKTGSQATKNWSFSFHLKDLLKPETIRMDPIKIRGEREVGGRPDEVPYLGAETKRPLEQADPIRTRSDMEDRGPLQRDIDVASALRNPLPQPAPFKVRAPENLVLFSEEERAAYKTDSKQLNLVRHDLTDRRVNLAQDLPKRLGADGMKTTREQFQIQGPELLNSRLRQQTADAPRPQGLGDGRRHQDERRIDVDLERSETRITGPHLSDIQVPEGIGVSKLPVDTHPVEEPRIITLRPPRIATLAETRQTRADGDMGKKPMDEHRGVAVQELHINGPLVNYHPETTRVTSGLAKDGTRQFPAVGKPTPQGTTWLRTDKKATTTFASHKLANAGAWKGASQPTKTLTITTFTRDGNAGLDMESDVVFETGGRLLEPTSARNPHPRNTAGLPRLVSESTQRAQNEFRKR